jgi:hypothetical protein
MSNDVNREVLARPPAARRPTGCLPAALAVAGLLGAAAVFHWALPDAPRTGRVLLLTDADGPPLLAEVIDASGAAVAGPFPIPSQEPARLPAGPCRLRVVAPGRLSQVWQLDVEPGPTADFYVPATPPAWPRRVPVPPVHPAEGRAMPPRPPFEVVRLGGRRGASATVVLHDPPRGLDGETGATLWAGSRDWPVPDAPAPSPFATPVTYYMRPLGMAPDLNGDGTGDMIWLFDPPPALVAPAALRPFHPSPHPAVLAVSGRTYRPLWSFPPPLPAAAELQPPLLYGARGVFFPRESTVVGEPAVLDVDRDGLPDLIVTLAAADGARRLAALSGRTGQPLWHFDPGPALLDPQGQPEAAARVLTFHRRVAVVWQRDTRLYCLDGATGRLLRPPLPLGCRPIREVGYADLDGDGEPEAVVIGAVGPDRLSVAAVALASGAQLWRHIIPQEGWEKVLESRQKTPRGFYRENDPEYPLIADLDGDGRPEVIMPRWTDLDGVGFSRRLAVEVWEGASGTRRWRRDLARYAWLPARAPPRLTVGPDLDGDGRREVFAVTALQDLPLSALHAGVGGEPQLFADALSGADGHSVWWRQFPLAVGLRPGPLRWWHAGPDGRPLLLVPLASKDGSEALLWVLESSSGRLCATVDGLTSVRLADLDGDGVLDLVGIYRPAADAEGWLSVIRGRPAPAAEDLLPVPDEDPRQSRPLPWTGVEDNPTELLALVGVLAFTVCLVALPVAAWRARRRRRFFWVLGAATAAAGLPGLLCLAAHKMHVPAVADFGTLLPVLALPAAVPLALILQAVATRRWLACLGVFALLSVFTLLAGAILLALDLPLLRPGENYSLRGWFFVTYYGAYVAGLVLGPLALINAGPRTAVVGKGAVFLPSPPYSGERGRG